jgi:NAD+ kinase
LRRARIRTTLEGENLNLQPIELHDQVLNHLEHRYIEHIEENRTTKLSNSDILNTNTNNKTNTTVINNTNNERIENDNKISRYVVPILSLNEVFIGESLSPRVSYYQMSVDDGPFFRQKSSGIIICTGTGSTSWCFNINKLSSLSLHKLFKICNYTFLFIIIKNLN